MALIAMPGPSDNERVTQRKANRRLGLALASVALVFFLGFMAKMILLSH